MSGAGGAITFTDDATKNSFVKITNFTAGDSIRVTGATEGQYSFSSSDLDGDGSADDLSIVYNAGSGVVNDIQILNVVSPSDFVFDSASAIKAVGFNSFTRDVVNKPAIQNFGAPPFVLARVSFPPRKRRKSRQTRS